MRITNIFLCLLFTIAIQAQDHLKVDSDTYVKVEIDLSNKSIKDLAKAGVDITHGTYVRNISFSAVFPEWKLEEFSNMGFEYDVLIPNMQEYYISRNNNRGPECEVDVCFQNAYNYAKPQNFELGSMGGFFTYNQMLDHLDAMSFTYPNLITVRAPIGEFKTHNGNDIFWIKISDNPLVDEEEPEVLYTALHHAREPMSMTQMIYYMWYLLEQYSQNPEVRNILDETELYFIPCINPDGYILNNQLHPDGGGMWRKNARDNNSDNILDEREDGVDINRNYGHNWGHDNEGSSSNAGSDTYRGPEPFSEPETQAVKFFCENHDFKLALNYHSFGNVLLYPFGYDTEAEPEDLETFENFGELLVRENDYLYGTSFTTLDYNTNGDANDWMYGDDQTKPAILTFTPEVGSSCDDFYPEIENIIPLCEQTLGMNLQLTKLVHGYGFIEEVNSQVVLTQAGDLEFLVSNYSTDPTQFVVHVEPLSDNILTVDLSEETINLNKFDQNLLSFSYALIPDILAGDEVSFLIVSSNGKTTEFDTIRKIYAPAELLIVQNGDNLEGWTQSGNTPWGTSPDAYEGAFAYTDSPGGNYDKNLEKPFMLTQEIDLADADAAFVEFWAKWEIDDFFDYVVFQVSENGGSWENLCGEYTTPGSIFQEDNQPIYDAIQEEWVREHISLDTYLGQKIRLRFVLYTDGFNELDGFYFDEFVITAINQQKVSTYDPLADGISMEEARPNPASDLVRIPVTFPSQFKQGKIILMDVLGKPLTDRVIVTSEARQFVEFDATNLVPGVYFYALQIDGQLYQTKRILIQ
jgi:hypothetical protein